MNLARKHLLGLGLAILLVTNLVALLGVAYNRGEPESTFRLSERELRPQRTQQRENSGLALQLRWRVLTEKPEAYDFRSGASGNWRSARWLDRKKMAELGFDVSLPDTEFETRRSFRREPTRDALLVLEFDGPAYQESLWGAINEAERLRATGKADAAKLAEEIVPMETKTNSRLFVVDAGLDAAALRAKYPDRSRYAIVTGQVRPATRYGRDSSNHAGSVAEVNVDAVNVSLDLRPTLAGALDEPAREAPYEYRTRYEGVISFGRRLEPWLVTATRK